MRLRIRLQTAAEVFEKRGQEAVSQSDVRRCMPWWPRESRKPAKPLREIGDPLRWNLICIMQQVQNSFEMPITYCCVALREKLAIVHDVNRALHSSWAGAENLQSIKLQVKGTLIILPTQSRWQALCRSQIPAFQSLSSGHEMRTLSDWHGPIWRREKGTKITKPEKRGLRRWVKLGEMLGDFIEAKARIRE